MTRRHALVPLLVVAALAVPTSSVATSCVGPVRSRHAFVGTVLSTTSGGAVAVVRTEAGRTVQVEGSQGTSVEQTYEVGRRYEFHPVNAASPYQDHLCTATRVLQPGEVPAAAQGDGDGGASSALRYAALGLSTAVAVLLVLAALRRRGPSRASPAIAP